MKLLQGSAREVLVLVVDRLDAGAVHRQKLTTEEVELAAMDDELTEHLPESRSVHPPETGDGTKIRLEMSQQPDDLDVAVAFRFQPTARSNTVGVAVRTRLV